MKKKTTKMPVYTYRCKDNGEEFTTSMSISEMEQFEVLNNGRFERVLKPVSIGDPIRLSVTKSPSSWNDLVKTIKSRNRGSTIQTKNGEV